MNTIFKQQVTVDDHDSSLLCIQGFLILAIKASFG